MRWHISSSINQLNAKTPHPPLSNLKSIATERKKPLLPTLGGSGFFYAKIIFFHLFSLLSILRLLLRIFKSNLVLYPFLRVLGERLIFQQQYFCVRVKAFLLQSRLFFRATKKIVRGNVKRIGNLYQRFKVRFAGAQFIF